MQGSWPCSEVVQVGPTDGLEAGRAEGAVIKTCAHADIILLGKRNKVLLQSVLIEDVPTGWWAQVSPDFS